MELNIPISYLHANQLKKMQFYKDSLWKAKRLLETLILTEILKAKNTFLQTANFNFSIRIYVLLFLSLISKYMVIEKDEVFCKKT